MNKGNILNFFFTFLFWTRIQEIVNQFQKISALIFLFSYPSNFFFPHTTILFPVKEIPGWVPAPIPQYSPPPFHPQIKVTNLSPIPESCFNQTNPEYPALVNLLTNAVVFSNATIVTSNYYIPTFTYYNDDIQKTPFKVDFHTYKVVDQAITLFHAYLKTYYHFIIETFPLILCFSKEIIENSVILHGRVLKNQFNELCSLLNLNFKGKIFVRKPVYVKKLYVANSNIFIEFNANAVRHFRHLMLEKCNATNLKATQNVYYNRPKNRRILNFNELKAALKNEFSNEEFIEPHSMSMAEQVVFWRKTRFAMMVHGSIFSNFIFMHPNTAYLEFNILVCRNPAQKLCQSFGIHIYSMLFKRHCLNRSMHADIPDVILAVKRIFKMLETQDLSLY